MSRAALLPYPGDPLLLNYWLKLFNEVWGDEIDRLYIGFNSPIEEPVLNFIEDICAHPKITLHIERDQKDHGPTINTLLDWVQEEYIMLIEDDGFIFKKGVVDQYFQCLENGQYDIVGSKRGSCSQEISEIASKKWGIAYEGEGDHGPNFWPNFLFLRADLLRSTDRNFSAKQWKQGEKIEGLDHIVTSEFVNGDTLVNTSLQLRGMVPIERILCIPQYHGHPSDIQHFKEGKYLFDGQAPWTHVGSLSSGVGGILMDDKGRSLSRRLIDPPKEYTKLPNYCNTEQEREEFERRVQWWLRFYDYYIGAVTPVFHSIDFDYFVALYKKAIDRIIDQYQLSREHIQQRQDIYKTLGL